MPFYAIALLAAGTYVMRIVGPAMHSRVSIPPQIQRLASLATIAVLLALAATSTLLSGHAFAGWARPAGVLVGGVLALRRVPFPVVVVAAALTTALLRVAGVS
jgi:branched chain amino acid efflux pump